MFGFNMKDQFGQPLYKQVDYEGFVNIVKGMVALARSQPPFDFEKAVADAKEDKSVKTEMVGPMLRVKGPASIKMIDQYTRFVRMGLHALQLCYYEIEVPELGRMGQLTAVDNYGIPIEDKLIPGLIAEFFGDECQARRMETPPHVLVAVCKVGE